MRALLSYTLGFALPAFAMAVLLYIDFNSDSWSGYSPLNRLPMIPMLYLVYGFVAFLAWSAARWRPARPSHIFIAGLVSGLPLFIFSRHTAFLFPGWTAIGLLVGGAAVCVATLTWRSTKQAG